MNKTSSILIDEYGRTRSGWRAAVFLFAFVLVSIVFAFIAKMAVSLFHVDAQAGTLLSLIINSLIGLVPAVLIGWLCGKLFEKLPFRAIGAAFTSGWLTHLLLGGLVGAATLSLAVLVAFVSDGERFEWDAGYGASAILSSLCVSFAVFALASAFEEALFRGYLLQTFSRAHLAWLAIAGTSVFFGAVHLGNPNATVISTANTILAGIWFSVAYLKTRDLWFVWGVHLMWNWMQGSFFGIEVSGLTQITTAPLLREIDSGPVWLTGQSYGIEGGIVCTLAIIISTAAIWFLPVAKPDPEILAMSEPPAAPSPI